MENTLSNGFKGEKAIVTPYNIRAYLAKNEITKYLYITHIGYYPDAGYHFRSREGGADENIFIYCEKGCGWIEYKEERFFLKENSFFILPKGEKHAYGADKHNPWSIYWLHFKGEKCDLFKSLTGKLISLDQSDQSRQQDRLQLFNEIYQNLDMGYNPENLEYITFCFMHFLASLKYIPQYREIKRLKENNLIQRCIIFMKENLENRISMNDLATAMGYSCSHLNTLFTQQTSFSPIEYYNQLRIQRACSYLQFTNQKIKEIAFHLNFYDPYHFSKAFYKEMGITPKEYRKQYRDQSKEVLKRED